MLSLVSMLAAVSGASAETATYKCDPNTVDKEARAVAYTTVAVGVHSNGKAHICTFSIDAANSGGSQSPSGAGPVAGLLESAIDGDPSELAIRIFIPRGEINPEILDELTALLAGNSEDLDRCLTALRHFDDKGEPIETLEEGGLLYLSQRKDRVQLDCSVFPPGDNAYLRTPVPTMRLRALLEDSSTDSLYVPASAL